jgi:Tol biopolymer transport system component
LVAEALPTGARPSWWRPVAVGMTTLLCLVMVGSGIRPAEAAGTQTKQNRQIWVSAIEDASESIPSADGRYVAFTDWNTGDLGIRDLKVGKSRRLTTNGDWETSGYYDYAESPAVSPDNRQIVYTWWIDKERRAELRVLPVNGGAARTLQRSATGDYYKVFGWTPDGKQILVVRRLGECQVALVSVQDGSAGRPFPRDHPMEAYGVINV